MPESSEPESRRFPSRKSLREQTARDTGAPSGAEAALREETVETARLAEASIRPHDPVTTAPSTPAARPIKIGRKIAAATAAASVCGLLLTATLPLTGGHSSVGDDTAAAASQRLFSTAEPPEWLETTTVSAIEAVAQADDDPSSYAFKADTLVNYPFVGSVLLTDVFGYRTAPVEQFHDAQDFAASEGTPIQAIADGTVLEAGFATDGCGFGLKVEHDIDGHDVTSRYCHMQMDSHSLSVGDEIAMGDPVGRVGATGLAFGAHLHLALVMDDEPIDPMPFFTKYTRMKREDATTPKPSPVDAIPASADAVAGDPEKPTNTGETATQQ